jgi:two-component system response regulator YesN
MSYKVIIADDEPLVLVGLQSLINWEENDCQICAIAHNGKQLLSSIDAHCPDIVITDIMMPLVNGIDVLKIVFEKGEHHPVSILLTNLEDFESARCAMKYGACDYLVKIELTTQTLLNSLNNAKSKINQQRSQNKRNDSEKNYQTFGIYTFRDKFFVRLYNGLINSTETFIQQRDSLKINLDYNYFQVCYLELIGLHDDNMNRDDLFNLYNATTNMLKETVSKFNDCYVTSLDVKHVAILLGFDKVEDSEKTKQLFIDASKIVKDYFSVDLYTGVSLPFTNTRMFSNAFRKAKQAQSLSGKDYKVVLAKEGKDLFDFNDYRNHLAKAFENMDYNRIESVLSTIAENIVESNLSFVVSMDISTNILFLSISFISNGENIINGFFNDEDGYRSIYRAQTNSDCANWILTLKDGLRSYLLDEKQDYRAVAILNVKKYIEDNVDKKILLPEVSSLFGFSQNYLSCLFSKYAGIGFVEYINKTKVNRAKELFVTGDYKIYEVADKLGFDSSFYFSKVFKKFTGKSPRLYIQTHKKEK